MRIDVVIDELVLAGFDARDRHRIADAVARALEQAALANPDAWRLAAGAPVLAATCAVDQWHEGASARATGRAIAGAIGRAILETAPGTGPALAAVHEDGPPDRIGGPDVPVHQSRRAGVMRAGGPLAEADGSVAGGSPPAIERPPAAQRGRRGGPR